MIKRFIGFCLVVIILFFIIPLINAGTIGISPGIEKFYFEPNLERNFTFYISSSDINGTIKVYSAGDLKDYIKLSNSSLIQGGEINVELKLPEKIDIPGNHVIYIGALESSNAESGIGMVEAVQASINIFVPYPGKYAKATFNILDINEGENPLYTLEINNLGTEDFTVVPEINIYDMSNKTIFREELNSTEIKSKETKDFTGVIGYNGFKPGPYKATVNFDYGKEMNLESDFRVGTLFMNITDYSYEFEEGKINKFYIESENLWNSNINAYAEVTITNNGKIIDDFKTPSMDFGPWQRLNLTGFLDATKITQGRYLASINIFYSNISNNKLVAIYVNKPPTDPIWNTIKIISISVGIILLLLVLLIIYLLIKIKRIKKNGNKNKK